MRRVFAIILFFFLLCQKSFAGPAGIDPKAYGIDPDSLGSINVKPAKDSLLQKSFTRYPVISRMEPSRTAHDRSPDFYLLLGLCLLLGVIRYTDPRYFAMLMRAARTPASTRSGLREGIQSAVISNFLMNVFFGVVAGAYLFYLVRSFGNSVSRYLRYGNTGLLMACTGGMLAIYLIKYAVIRFSGWVFRVSTITDQYIFNVFLINKIIGIVLLPFVVLLAFADPVYGYSLVAISLLATGLLFTLRYVRSWPVFASFFEHSRFHFFTYLCASEILPMAIIVKLLLHYAA